MADKLYSKSQIASKLGTNPMRVSRFIERKKITPVKKTGKRELYKLTDFNVLKDELDDPKTESKAQSHGFSKDDYILTLKKQLDEQKEQFEKVLASKDETIASLRETVATSDRAYEDMKKQLAVKDGQIDSLTKLTNNAQTLNLVDKDPKRLEAAKTDTDNNAFVSEQREDEKNTNDNKEHWWKKIF